MANILPAEFLNLNEMTTSSKGVVVLYGRRTDGSLIAVNVDANGNLPITVPPLTLGAVQIQDGVGATKVTVNAADGAKGTETALVVQPQGSTNAYYIDQATTVLTGAYQNFAFGFTSFSITVINDDPTQIISYSFDGATAHGLVKPSEGFTMDYRAQPRIYLKTISGAAAQYRLSSY